MWNRMRQGPNTPLQRCAAGDYDFDFNTDGLAHYGMIPDLLQDLVNVGADESMVNALFSSAESYLELWERCDAWSRTPAPGRIRDATHGSFVIHHPRH
jgi:hypothetical protein